MPRGISLFFVLSVPLWFNDSVIDADTAFRGIGWLIARRACPASMRCPRRSA
jgi:hypothetical protein